MRARWTAWLRMPSPAMVVAVIALTATLGGTAYAAGTTLTGRTHLGHVRHQARGGVAARADAVAAATTTSALPRQPFFGFAQVVIGQNTLIAANKATVALTRVELDNYFAQINAVPAEVELFELGGNATTCDGSSGDEPLGRYEIPTSQSVIDTMPTPVVLKPFATGDVWCLDANVSIQRNPSSYFLPAVSFSGWTAAGALPAGAVAVSSNRTGTPTESSAANARR